MTKIQMLANREMDFMNWSHHLSWPLNDLFTGVRIEFLVVRRRMVRVSKAYLRELVLHSLGDFRFSVR
jgi:hypothetical protein